MSLATDNVQDAFYPYGSYDLLETFGLGVQMAHLAPGCPADLVLLAATDEHELIGPRGRQRIVIRAGRILEQTQ